MAKRRATKAGATADGSGAAAAAAAAVEELRRRATTATREGMARYGIPSEKAFGVPVGEIQRFGKELGRSHELAAALWETGWYEARMLASMIDEAAKVTPEQMDRWCADFDSWAICDTVCFKLFDQSPHAWEKVVEWARLRDEFARRAAFALLACLALHDKTADDEAFRRLLPLAEDAADDERNFVKKGVSWALRAIGGRGAALRIEVMDSAARLAASKNAAARWTGKDALRDLARGVAARRATKGGAAKAKAPVKKMAAKKKSAK